MKTPLALLSRLRVTVGFVCGMSLATVILSVWSEDARQRLMLLSSTNLHGLSTHPVIVLIVSFFWSTPVGLMTFVAPAAVLLGVVEWKIGSWRTLTVVAAGHVGGSLLTASAIESGISLGTTPAGAAGAIDVGASYAIMAVLGFAVLLVAGRTRAVIGTAIFVWLTVGVLSDLYFTAFGHFFAALIGLSLGSAAWVSHGNLVYGSQ